MCEVFARIKVKSARNYEIRAEKKKRFEKEISCFSHVQQLVPGAYDASYSYKLCVMRANFYNFSTRCRCAFLAELETNNGLFDKGANPEPTPALASSACARRK